MKRYCCVTEADKIRFQKNVKDWCYDVNFFQLVFEQILLQEEEEEKQISEGNYESVLELNKLGNTYTLFPYTTLFRSVYLIRMNLCWIYIMKYICLWFI